MRLRNQVELAGLPDHVRKPDPSLYSRGNYIVADFETTTELKGSPLAKGNRIILACWVSRLRNRVDTGASRHTFGSEYEQGQLVKDIEGARFLVAHNAKFELGWLKRCGLDLRNVVVWDTMIADHVLGGNKYFPQQLSLNECAKRWGLDKKDDTVSRMIKGGCPVEDIPASWLQKYCEKDVSLTEQLFRLQLEECKRRGVLHIVYQRCLVTPALADMEFNGVQLATEEVESYAEDIEDLYNRRTAELQESCGGASPTSPKQLSAYVYDTLQFKVPRDYAGRPQLTSGGNGSVAAPVMESLRATTAKQRDFLTKYTEWKELDTAVTKYLRKFRECIANDNGRLRAVFNQCNTRTHRLSSSGLQYGIQFQNLDRGYKKFFCARTPGWLVGEIDGSQLEFRVAVHMGRDRVGLRNIRTEGFDIHALTATTLGVSRQDAKPYTFKPLYGGVGGTDKQREYFEAFKREYSGVATEQRQWVLKCLNNKQFTTEYGLTFYFPYCQMKESGWITHTTNIYNYPVQGFATAEIIPLALVACWHRMKSMKSFLVNTVHDSVIAEVHPDEQEVFHELARQCFVVDTYNLLDDLYNISLTVPLGAGVVIGDTWNQGEETKYEAPEEYYLEAAKEAGMIDE